MAQRAPSRRERSPELPHPQEIWDRVMELYSTSCEMAQEYQEAFGYAFDSPDRPTDDQRLRIATSGTSDRVGSVALTQQRTRRELAHLAQRIVRYEEKSSQIARSITLKIGALFTTVGEDDYEPLRGYRIQSEKETEDFTRAKAQREKRIKVAEAERLRRQLTKLEAEIRRADR